MKTKREDNNDEDEVREFPDLKRQKKFDDPSLPPAFLASENALHTLASYDDDDDDYEKEEKMKEASGLRGKDEEGEDDDDDDDDDDDPHQEFNQVKRSRMVEVRRDCPYLDTVNRQVPNSFLSTKRSM